MNTNTHQYVGPNSSLMSSSAFALNPSSAIFFAYCTSAVLYSCGLSNVRAACMRVSRCPSVSAVLHHAGRAMSLAAADECSLTVLSMLLTIPRDAIWLFARVRAVQRSEPSANQPSPSLTQEHSAAS